MRTAHDIRLEIDALSEQRSEAWVRLSSGDASARDDVAAVTARIEGLWLELREAAALQRVGPREQIIRRAKISDRFDREQLPRYLRARSAVGAGEPE